MEPPPERPNDFHGVPPPFRGGSGIEAKRYRGAGRCAEGPERPGEPPAEPPARKRRAEPVDARNHLFACQREHGAAPEAPALPAPAAACSRCGALTAAPPCADCGRGLCRACALRCEGCGKALCLACAFPVAEAPCWCARCFGERRARGEAGA